MVSFSVLGLSSDAYPWRLYYRSSLLHDLLAVGNYDYCRRLLMPHIGQALTGRPCYCGDSAYPYLNDATGMRILVWSDGIHYVLYRCNDGHFFIVKGS